MAQAVDIELLRQSILFQDTLEPPREGGGRHGQPCALTSEQEVIGGQFSFIVGLGNVLTLMPVLSQEAFYLGGEVDVPVARTGLGFLDEDLVAGDFYRIAADVNGVLLPVNVPPLQGAALAPPHSRGDDELDNLFVQLRRYPTSPKYITFSISLISAKIPPVNGGKKEFP